jgi:hypothetical protein
MVRNHADDSHSSFPPSYNKSDLFNIISVEACQVFSECSRLICIPLTADHQVVMVRQYRYGSKEVPLEIPGG